MRRIRKAPGNLPRWLTRLQDGRSPWIPTTLAPPMRFWRAGGFWGPVRDYLILFGAADLSSTRLTHVGPVALWPCTIASALNRDIYVASNGANYRANCGLLTRSCGPVRPAYPADCPNIRSSGRRHGFVTPARRTPQDGHLATLVLSMYKTRLLSTGFRRLRQEFGNFFVVRHSSPGELAGGQRRTPLPVAQNSAEREQGGPRPVAKWQTCLS